MFFTSSELKLIRGKCPGELQNLMYALSVSSPDDIDTALCQLMNSRNIYDGYTSLLRIGNVDYSLSCTDNEMLGLIVDNRDKIIAGCANIGRSVPAYESEYTVAFCSKMTDTNRNRMLQVFGRIYELERTAGILQPGLFGPRKDSHEMEKLLREMEDIIARLPNTGIDLKSSRTCSESELAELINNSNEPFIAQRAGRKPQAVTRPSFSGQDIERVLDVLEQVHNIFRSIGS